jgi:hypothetical protein
MCAHSVGISLHYTTSLHTVLCFSTPAVCLERNYPVVFEMCQDILTRSVLLLLQFEPMGQILRPFSCCTVSQANNNFFNLHQFFGG